MSKYVVLGWASSHPRLIYSVTEGVYDLCLVSRTCCEFGARVQAWSNGELHNVRHRVRCVAGVQRVSIALFLLAPKDDVVRAPEAFVSAERPRRFRDFGYDDYRRLRQSTGEHAGEALARLAA